MDSCNSPSTRRSNKARSIQGHILSSTKAEEVSERKTAYIKVPKHIAMLNITVKASRSSDPRLQTNAYPLPQVKPLIALALQTVRTFRIHFRYKEDQEKFSGAGCGQSSYGGSNISSNSVSLREDSAMEVVMTAVMVQCQRQCRRKASSSFWASRIECMCHGLVLHCRLRHCPMRMGMWL